MPGPAVRFLPCVVIAVCLAVAPAQERRTFGAKVVDAAGRPVAGATVLLTTPRAAHLAVAAPEVVTATSDAEGRCKAALLVGASYAMGALRVDGDVVAVSPLVSGVGAGEYREFVLGPAGPRRTVRVEGCAAWGELAPSRLRLCLRAAPGLVAEVELAADGTARLPALPAGPMLCEFLTTAGATLVHTDLADPWAGGAPLVLTLPPPRRIVLRVRDDAGQPVAGASLAQRTVAVHHTGPGAAGACVREAWRELGRSDGSGELTALLPDHREWLEVFTARRDGFATAVAGRVGDDKRAIDARHAPQAPGDELHFTLAPARPLVGRILTDLQTPLAGVRAWVEVTFLLPLPQGGSTYVPLLEEVTTDAQGAWNARGVPADFVMPRLLAGPELPAPEGMQLPPVLAEAAGRVAALPAVVLAELPQCTVQVTRADGSPAEGAAVFVVPTERRRWFVETWDARHRLDRARRLRLATASRAALLCCTDGVGFASARLDASTARLVLQLDAMPAARWQIHTPAGVPAVGAELVLASYSPAVDETDPWQQALAAVAVSLHAAWCDGLRADASGHVTLRRVPAPGALMDLRIEHASGTLADLRFTPGERTLQLAAR
ncbi:MAG: carboxypeptidase regulatory-like domain-containing protein [Planctomycetes bacterium]|nr:carboxypeptidase regulatory-like domain-containing protein [Planctomycetota bacterium]